MGADDLDFRIFDCDNHYYEAEDAFTRHRRSRRSGSGACSGPRSTVASACWSEARSTVSFRTRRGIRFPSRGARRVLPGSQPEGRGHPGAVRRTRPAGRPPRIPESRRPAGGHGRAGPAGRHLPAHPRCRHGAGAAGTTCPPWWPPSGPSTDGWRRTGASPTRSGSSPPPTSTLVDADERGGGAAVGSRPRRPLHRHGGRPGGGRRGGPVAGRSGLRPLLVARQRIGGDRLLPRW